MIGLIYYGAGNLFSLQCALDRVGAAYNLITEPAQLSKVNKLIIPGVGHAEAAMKKLNATGLVPYIQETEKPVLGICLGMQLLTSHSEEGDTNLLNLLPLRTKRFNVEGMKVPQMGWNTVDILFDNPLFKGISSNTFFYFVHSYAVESSEKYSLSLTDYGIRYSSAIQKDNFYGVQFHPEKSGTAGEKLLKNFASL